MKFIDIHAHVHAYRRDPHLYGKTVLSAHTPQEMDDLLTIDHPFVWRSFGVHPQDPNQESLLRLQQILQDPLKRLKVNAIGEMGFDLWPEYRINLSTQESCFVRQLQLAVEYRLPLIIHQRRAMQYIFKYIKELKKIPGVILHCYAGTWNEALSLRKRGLLAYFSIGTPVLWGSKIASRLAKDAPLDWLFLETDAPYQPLKNEKNTQWHHIALVYAYVAQLRQISIFELESVMEMNFYKIFQKK